ncbi:MAG: hypothetical protein Q9160_004903 [Pyrenula sp. 1 TL-2023]
MNRHFRRRVSGEGSCKARIAGPRTKFMVESLTSTDQTRSGIRDANDITEHTRATSFVSWSPSPPLQGANCAYREISVGNESGRVPADKHTLQEFPEESICQNSNQQVFGKKQNSSMSNSSLAALARDSLRANVFEGRGVPPSNDPGIHNYSLEDLRDLVHLSSPNVSSGRPCLKTADSFKREKNAQNILPNRGPQSLVKMENSDGRNQYESASALPVASPRKVLIPTQTYTINDFQSVLDERPQFLGEFRISPSKANALLNLPSLSSLPRQRIQRQPSGSLNDSSAVPLYDDYYLAREDNRGALHVPMEHLHANESVSPGPGPGEPFNGIEPRLPASHRTGLNDIMPLQKYSPPEMLEQDLFPLNEADLLGYCTNFDNSVLYDDDSGLHNPGPSLAEHQDLRPTQAYDPASLDSSVHRRPGTISYVNVPHSTQPPGFPPNDATRLVPSPRPTTAAESWSNLPCKYPPGVDTQSSMPRPTLLRAENLRHDAYAGGENALEGFWRRRPGMPC